MKSFRLFIAFLVSLMVVSPASALSEPTLNMYSQNNILFYDPTGNSRNGCFVGNGAVSVTGSTADEMMWSGLTSVGFTDVQAAAVLGNIASEGIGNPAQHEGALYNQYWSTGAAPDNVDGHFNLAGNEDISYGLGLVQWSFGRRIGLYNYIGSQAPELLQYFNDPVQYSMKDGNIYALGGDGFIERAGIEAAQALFSYEIAYIWQEVNDSYQGILEQTDLSEATHWFLAHYEIPKGDLSFGGEKHMYRLSKAEAYFDKFAGTYEFAGGTSASNGSGVTIIGDSITNRANLDNAIANVLPEATVYAQDSKFFDDDRSGNESGLSILASLGDSLGSTLVFALGTNDENVDQSAFQQVVDAAGSSRTVVFVTAYDSSNPSRYDGLNSTIQAVASANSNVVVADWAAAASADPTKYIDQSDGSFVHPTYGEGTALFAKVIADAVNRNAGADGCAPGSGFVGTVLGYAWPEYHAAQFLDRMPAYEATVTNRVDNGIWVGGSVQGVPGIDCGGFVTILVQDSGWDPNYNKAEGGGIWGATDGQEQYAKTHWTALNPSGVIDTSILQPGDVAFTDGHTFIYVGEIPGFDSNIASASYSYDGSGGRAPMAGRESIDTYDGGAPVRWYRKQ